MSLITQKSANSEKSTEYGTPTPWLMRIRFTQISLTQLFKKNPDNADSLAYTRTAYTYIKYLLTFHIKRNSRKVKI